VSDTPTPRTDSCVDWPSPEYTQRIQFEGCTCAVMAPEDYEALYKHAQQLERELADAKDLLQKACAELPVSYYPGNTPDKLPSNIAGFVKEYTENFSDMQKALDSLEQITAGHFYQSSCRGGEMERLMNQAIQSVSVVNPNQESK